VSDLEDRLSRLLEAKATQIEGSSVGADALVRRAGRRRRWILSTGVATALVLTAMVVVLTSHRDHNEVSTVAPPATPTTTCTTSESNQPCDRAPTSTTTGAEQTTTTAQAVVATEPEPTTAPESTTTSTSEVPPPPPTAAQVDLVMSQTVPDDAPNEHYVRSSDPVVVGDGAGGTLTAVAGSRTNTADGGGQLVFFWHNDTFIGWNTDHESFKLQVDPQGADAVGVTYVWLQPDDAACCPTGQAVVVYGWDGSGLRSDRDIPPGAAEGTHVHMTN